MGRSSSCMEPADSIRRLGFARWYERRLIEGHAWFISAFICITAIAACMEELSFRGSIIRLLVYVTVVLAAGAIGIYGRSEEHTSELQSPCNLVCRLLLEKKKKKTKSYIYTKRTIAETANTDTL